MEAQATVIHRRRSSIRSVGSALGALATSAADVVEEVMRAAASVAPETRRRRKPCGCGEPCGHEHCNCHCTCCVCDADLVVYTRVGEQRVVPVRIENERSRERQVKLSVSDFTTRGGSASPVKVSLLGGTDLTIAPCATEDTTLLVASGAGPDDVEKPPKRGERTRLPDVDDCVVAVGDLRVDGCDIRPVRIAVAVVPRDCSPYEIGCGCACC
jgi:hypothetical protein